MPLFRKKGQADKEAERFTKDFTELIRQITSALNAAVSTEQAEPSLKMLEGLASYGMPEAQTFHGLAYLMDDKPWYDYGKGLEIMKEAADDDDPRSAFSMHQLGRVYLEGRKGVQSDPVSGKWWIEQAAGLGFRPAIEEKESRWGI